MREATGMTGSLERKEQLLDALTCEKVPGGGGGAPEDTRNTSEAARRMEGDPKGDRLRRH